MIVWSKKALHNRKLRWIPMHDVNQCLQKGTRQFVTAMDSYITYMISYRGTDVYYVDGKQHILIVDIYKNIPMKSYTILYCSIFLKEEASFVQV